MQFGSNFGNPQQFSSGQLGTQPGMFHTSPQQSAAQWGAHEALEVHESLSSLINAVNTFELYRPFIRDQQLMSILDRQIQHMNSNYQNLLGYVHSRSMHSAESFRVPRSGNATYGLRQPSPIQPNMNPNMMDDRDVSLAMLGINKSCSLVCSISSLECADFDLRQMVTNCAVSCNTMAYEIFQYMNQKGYYQVPTMMPKTTNTMIQTYQPAGLGF